MSLERLLRLLKIAADRGDRVAVINLQNRAMRAAGFKGILGIPVQTK